MKVIDKLLDEVYIIESPLFQDERGAFLKVFNNTITPLADYHIQQVNYVETVEKHTLRGLHYQKGEFAESKFFRVVKGKAQLAFVDVRVGSNTYLKAETVVLDSPSKGVLIPRGFATGYLSLEDNTIILYSSDNIYYPKSECGILWNDNKLGISWLVEYPILSEKDKNWDPLKN